MATARCRPWFAGRLNRFAGRLTRLAERLNREPARRNRPPRPHRERSLPAAVIIGLVASGLFVWQGTVAAFSSTTANPMNSWTAGSVTLADDDAGSALFAASGLVPGSAGSNCITVTYSGTLPTSVKLYAAASSDASSVAQYLDVTIEEGTGGGFGSCTGFSAASTIYSGTLATFTSTKSSYATGVGTWAPSSVSTKVYKISYTLNAATPSAKQGASTAATFQWEAQA